MSQLKRLFVIDTMALAFRSFYALGRSSLSTKSGLPTGAIYGSALFMQKLLSEQQPDYLLAVTDTPEPTFRHQRYPAYKANRGEMPEDLSQQIPYIFSLLQHLRCPLLKVPGVEADDVIGTVAKRFAGPDLAVYIVSGDKDFMQIVDDRILMFVPKKNEDAVIVDPAAARERFHCTPDQVIDVLALIGDAVDNVPGVHGIGEKGAAKLIETYGSLSGIYERLDEISAKKQREALIADRENAFLSRELVTLKTDLDLPISLDQTICHWQQSAANPELLSFYQELGFKSLSQKVKSVLGESALASTPESQLIHHSALSFTEVLDDDTAQKLYDAAASAREIFITVATSGSDVVADKAINLALITDLGDAFQLPLSEAGIYYARQILSGSATKVAHGWKLAIEMLLNIGIDVKAPYVDLEICDYLIDPNHYDHGLNSLAQRYLDRSELPNTLMEQTVLLSELHKVIAPRINELSLNHVLSVIEMPLVPVLADMERTGVFIDAEYLASYSDELSIVAKTLEEQIYESAGGAFNINSSKQLQELLYTRLKLHELAGLKRLKKTKTGFSTDESVLSQLAPSHPIPDLILQYRTVTKLKSTYVDALPQFLNARSHRIHTHFNQTVAATGRLSSDKPNLQNIPNQSPLGRRIRKAFKPPEADAVLISADYSQVEIRLLAHLAEATDLIAAFKLGLDVHRVTAAKIFGIPEADVSSELRSQAKAVNFGIIYGMGPQRLAAQTGVTLAAAKDFISRYFEVYPGIKSYTAELVKSARATGYCVTMFGRRRPIPELRDGNQTIQNRGENIAVNAPIQGSAADLIKLAMIKVHHALKAHRLQTKMLLQVHDELVFSAPESEVEAVVPMIRDCMENAITTRVPLKVDISWGPDWLAAH